MTEKLRVSLNSRTLICIIKCKYLSQQMTWCTNVRMNVWNLSKLKPGALYIQGKELQDLDLKYFWYEYLHCDAWIRVSWQICRSKRNFSSAGNGNKLELHRWLNIRHIWSILSNICHRQHPLMTPRSNEVIIEFCVMILRSFHFKLINQSEISPSNWICCYRT